jgi:hypothetical protein
MNDLQQGMRVFSYAVSGFNSGEVSGFPFLDSAGNNIKCNYMKAEIHYDGNKDENHVVAWIEPSGLSQGSIATNPTEEYGAAEFLAGEVSGSLGFCLFADSGHQAIVEWKASNSQGTKGVNIKIDEYFQNTAGEIYVIITYGNILPFNHLRLNNYDFGV